MAYLNRKRFESSRVLREIFKTTPCFVLIDTRDTGGNFTSLQRRLEKMDELPRSPPIYENTPYAVLLRPTDGRTLEQTNADSCGFYATIRIDDPLDGSKWSKVIFESGRPRPVLRFDKLMINPKHVVLQRSNSNDIVCIQRDRAIATIRECFLPMRKQDYAAMAAAARLANK
ncbi:MAG TPA: hypothetical protein VNM40_04260 [Candidatus Paceibacterota bacterium]|nr:hypothetical protein [Candidatus Paceibacterota bacterium]